MIDMKEVLSAGDSSSSARDVLSVLWAITKGCNYMCSYCPYSKDTRFSEFSSKEDLLNAAKTIIRLGRPGYQITLYGGEPTYHPHFLDLLSYLAASGSPVSLRMFTNGSRPYKFFNSVTEALDGKPFGVIFSCHPEYAKFENFKKCVQTCADSGMSVGVNLMFISKISSVSKSYIDELFTLCEKTPFFMEINFPYTTDGVLDEWCAPDDVLWVKNARQRFQALPEPEGKKSPNFVRTLCNIVILRDGERAALAPRESLQLLEALNTPSYRDFYCCSGTNVIFLEEDGAYRGGVCDTSKVMGNLFHDSELSVVRSMGLVKFTSAACNSIENIPLPKFRDLSEAEVCINQFRGRSERMYISAEAKRLKLA